MEAIEVLRKILVGSFISRFSVGDTWDFYFDEYWLTTHNVVSKNENDINNLLTLNYQLFENAVDRENISKCAIVASAMRQEIIDVSITESCGLEIKFENNLKLFIPTDNDIVDWQWCLNKTNKDPYQDYLVVCFWPGKIEVNETKL